MCLARYLTDDRSLAHELVQFHPSYGYEEFVEGLRPVVEHGGVQFKRVDGVIKKMAEEIAQSGERRVLVIDEMNRANLPRVFGELMYLLEYRDEPIDLMYSSDFSLPPSLMIIGTMNTADRSIRSIDVALRRRFDVFECPPEASILEWYFRTHVNEIPDLIEGFERLNADLAEQLDRHHLVGHSFFMEDPLNAQALRRIWDRQIFPLLEEYFFDQPDLVSGFSLEKYWPQA
jgi:5-methylcytosine-specific restriction protein B